jgi:salicylate hydroxylase
MTSSSKHFSVAVIGGGIAGVTLTISLLARNIDVHLYERDADFEEVGAGIGFDSNAIKAMSICDPGIKKGFDKVATSSGVPGKETAWFDFIDGYSKNDDSSQRRMFNIYRTGRAQGCHRAHFLDECVKLIPKNVTHFRKQLDTVIDQGEKGLVLQFSDGSSATADAVVGCDGIRSRVRQLILGEDNPESYPQYSHAYAYRGLLPIDKAVEAMGKDTAMSRVIHVREPLEMRWRVPGADKEHVQMGAGAFIITYPVADGKLLNVAAFMYVLPRLPFFVYQQPHFSVPGLSL